MVPRWLVALPLLVPACFHPSYDHPTCGQNGECPSGLTCSAQQICERDGTPTDAPPTDTPPTDAPNNEPFCVGRFVLVCRPTTPPNLALLAPETINTDADPRCDLQDQGPGAPQLCVMAGNDVTVDAQITVVGSHPLVLAAAHDLNITANGSLVLTSPSGGTPGAGANDPACHPPMAVLWNGSITGSGGGAGGSFGGSGAAGGDGDAGYNLGGTAGAPIASITRVIGGCKGSQGGGTSGGLPGNGGGAVILLAANVLTLAGNVTAGGGGGLPATALNLAGGGGGSGGFVGLDAMLYAITGRVTANGGGGASGASNTTGGAPGTDGSSSTTSAAPGGQPPPYGGAGGGGSIATQTSGTAGQFGYCGGGGGGGGAGVILVKGAAPVGGSYSPPLTIVP